MIAGVSCGEGVEPREPTGGLTNNLLSGVSFPDSMILSGPFPEQRGPDAMILPIGGTVVLAPGQSGIMALEVEDDRNRSIDATLIQFEDQAREGGGQYIEVPADEELQATNIVENPFDVDEAVCAGVCDGVFTVSVKEAVKFQNGDISSAVRREIVVDCSEDGEPDACSKPGGGGGGAELIEGGVLCGDVAERELVHTGDVRLDGFFDAVVQLSNASEAASDEVGDAVAGVADVFESDETEVDAIAAAVGDEVEATTEAGLSLLIGELGCGVREREVGAAVARCSPDGFGDFTGLFCDGDCRLGAREQVCGSEDDARCRGLGEDLACEGECVGACAVELTTPDVCDGTCTGTCTGACPDDGSGGCLGPCEGDCSGECRAISMGECDGLCTGLCDGIAAVDDMCPGGTVRYCAGVAGEPEVCSGACFGQASLMDLSSRCGAIPLVIGDIYPLCEPTLIQVSFSFASGLDAAAQADFAGRADELNAPLRQLYEALTRIDRLVAAADDLLEDAADRVGPVVDDGDADDPAFACAMDQLSDAEDSVHLDLDTLAEAQDDAMTVLDALTAPPVSP